MDSFPKSPSLTAFKIHSPNPKQTTQINLRGGDEGLKKRQPFSRKQEVYQEYRELKIPGSLYFQGDIQAFIFSFSSFRDSSYSVPTNSI